MVLLPAPLNEIALIVRRKTCVLAGIVYRHTNEGVNRKEFKAYSETAAWLAYVSLGGTPETVDTFDWSGQFEALVYQTQRELRRILKGADLGFGDRQLREKVRPGRAHLSEFRWSSWREPQACETRAMTKACDAELESEERDTQLTGFVARVLNDALTDEEFSLVQKHYFQGISQLTLAKELASVNARYVNDPNGVEKAYNNIFAKTHRIRKKLRKLLGRDWQELSRELNDDSAA